MHPKAVEVLPGYPPVSPRVAFALIPRLRSEWLNMHLGGFHWGHNDLIDDNLIAEHRCPECRSFRDRTWPRA
jgi:hypothetical protein